MKRLLRDYGIAVGSYVALLSVGLVLTLTISSAVGYLPYSDRPGPGWTQPVFSFALLGFYLSWSVLLLLPTAIYGTVIFAWLRLLTFLDAPRVITRVVGALSAGLVAFYVTAGVGWYLSIALFPVFVAAGLGAGWGALLLPRFLGSQRLERRRWARWAISVVVLAGTGGLYWTFFAPRCHQHLSVSVVRVTQTEERLVTGREATDLEPHEAALLDSVFPNHHVQRGLSGVSSSGDGLNQARMLIVVSGPVATEAGLREPKGVSVVYIQRGDRWEMFPQNAPTISARVKIGPAPEPGKITFSWDGSDHPSIITWEFSTKHEAPKPAR
jgi:hypothetical protein